MFKKLPIAFAFPPLSSSRASTIKFNTYFDYINFWFQSSPFSNMLFTHQPKLLIFHSKIFLFHKKSLLHKIPDDAMLDVDCSPPQIKNPGYAYFYVWLLSFSTNQKTMLSSSRGQDIFEDLYSSRPRT